MEPRTRRRSSEEEAAEEEQVPLSTEEWLATFQMESYSAVLAREGYETTFALGMCDIFEATELASFGVYYDDAKILALKLHGPKKLVAKWTPLIRMMPTHVPMDVWLDNLPVSLVKYLPQLQSIGYLSLPHLVHIQLEDVYPVERLGMEETPAAVHTNNVVLPLGHARVLVHCARNMGYSPPAPADCSVPLLAWLEHCAPPLGHIEGLLKLEGITTVVELIKVPTAELMKERTEMVNVADKRALLHYVVTARTHWLDML